MVLVDTSVFLDFLKDVRNQGTEKLDHVLAMGIPFGINVYIYQELLQGTASERDYHELKKYLDTQNFYSFTQGHESYAQAAHLYFKCRKAGYTITSTIDCLIAQMALENGLHLLHNDRDFDFLRRVVKDLKIY